LHAKQNVDSTRIVVFGRSLGGAVGAALVRENPGKVDYLKFII
jgi:dienelactone hydrolase